MPVCMGARLPTCMHTCVRVCVCMFVCLVSMYGYTCQDMLVEIEDNLVLSFHLVCHRRQTQAIRLGDKHIRPLSYFYGPGVLVFVFV